MEREPYEPSEEAQRRHDMEDKEGKLYGEAARHEAVPGFRETLIELNELADAKLGASELSASEVEKMRDEEIHHLDNLMLEAEKIGDKVEARDIDASLREELESTEKEWAMLNSAIMDHVKTHPDLAAPWGVIFDETMQDVRAADQTKDNVEILESMKSTVQRIRDFAMVHLPQEELLKLHLIQKGELTEQAHEDINALQEQLDESIAMVRKTFDHLPKEAKKEYLELVQLQLNPEYLHAKSHAAKEPWRLERFYQSAIERIKDFLSKHQSKNL